MTQSIAFINNSDPDSLVNFHKDSNSIATWHFLSLVLRAKICNEMSFDGILISFPCHNETCEIRILEETDCQLWACYEHNPPPMTLTIVVIFVALLSFIALVLLALFKIKSNPRRENASLNQDQIGSQTTIQNRNCYFSIDTSSSEDFDNENVDARTPILRPPRRRGPIIQE